LGKSLMKLEWLCHAGRATPQADKHRCRTLEKQPADCVQHFAFINSQKILAHSGGFEYFHLVIPIN